MTYRQARYEEQVARIKVRLAEQELIIKQAECHKLKIQAELRSCEEEKQEAITKGEW